MVGSDPRGTSVAISGGGNRASLFGLGAVMAMTDAGVDITSVSSVSGGSLTNGWFAVKQTLQESTPEARRRNVGPFVSALANRGTFQSATAIPLWPLLALVVVAHAAFLLHVDRWWRFAIYSRGS